MVNDLHTGIGLFPMLPCDLGSQSPDLYMKGPFPALKSEALKCSNEL